MQIHTEEAPISLPLVPVVDRAGSKRTPKSYVEAVQIEFFFFLNFENIIRFAIETRRSQQDA